MSTELSQPPHKLDTLRSRRSFDTPYTFKSPFGGRLLRAEASANPTKSCGGLSGHTINSSSLLHHGSGLPGPWPLLHETLVRFPCASTAIASVHESANAPDSSDCL